MTKRDYYEILGINKNADDSAIKRAYRNLAMKYHPDRNPGDSKAAEKTKEILISIPRGAESGYRVILEGEGEPGKEEAKPGDLYVVLNVKRHHLFERHGDDIYVTKEISFPRAALGGEIENVPGLDGDVKLEIPEGTQTGAIFRIIDKGIPHLNDYGRGDEYIIVKVATPQDLTEQEKELIREFERIREERSGGELPQGATRVCEIGEWNEEEHVQGALPFLLRKGILGQAKKAV